MRAPGCGLVRIQCGFFGLYWAIVQHVDVTVGILREQVPVLGEREGRRVVTALLLHEVNGLAGGDELTGVAVSEVVNPDLASLRVGAQWLPHTLAEVVAIERRQAVAEDVAVEDGGAAFGQVGFRVHRQPDDGTAHAPESAPAAPP